MVSSPVRTTVASGRWQAKAAAGDKYVSLMGASAPQQCLRAGLLDEIQIHLVPVLLGAGVRLFDHLGSDNVELETIRIVDSPGVTHLRFRVVKSWPCSAPTVLSPRRTARTGPATALLTADWLGRRPPPIPWWNLKTLS
jgi:hypothetical protein